MKHKLVVGALLAIISVAAVADIQPDHTWPMASASLLLTAIGSHNADLLNRVVAPGATYFASRDAEEKKRSKPLALDSFAEVAAHCSVTAVNACSADRVSIDWICADRPADANEIYSDLHFNDASQVTSVTADTAPLVCMEARPLQSR